MLSLVFDIDGETRTVPIEGGSLILGRSKACDIVIATPGISGQHLRLDIRADKVSFRDLLSRNGTFLNGEKVREGKLRGGETLRLGKFEVRVVSDRPPLIPADDMGETAELPSKAAVGPAAASGDRAEYDAQSEETPANANFVPATVSPDPMLPPAVEVIRPGDGDGAQYPMVAGVSQPAGNQLAKKRVLYAVVTAVVVIAMGILLIPPESNDAGSRSGGLDYWGEVGKGEEAFRKDDYAEAYTLWHGIDKAWEKEYPNNPMPVAKTFAAVSRAFEDGRKGKYQSIRWRGLSTALKDIIELEDPPTAHMYFARSLLEIVEKQRDAETVYRAAERLYAAQEYEEAEKKYLEIPPKSMYQQPVPARVKACREARFDIAKGLALKAGAREEWKKGIELAREALAMRKDDKVLREKIGLWEENARVQALMRSYKRYLANGDLDQAATPRQDLDQVAKDHPVLRGFEQLKAQHDRALYVRRVKSAYQAWNTEALSELQKQTGAEQAEAAALFARAAQLKRAHEEAEAAYKRSQFFKARTHWKSMQAIEPGKAHPMNMAAAGRLREVSLDSIGKMLKRDAMEKFGKELYKDGREQLQIASDRCKMEVAKEIEIFHERGRKLYNMGVNLYHQKRYYEAKLVLIKALGCFVPGEKWYKTVREKYDQLFGGD